MTREVTDITENSYSCVWYKLLQRGTQIILGEHIFLLNVIFLKRNTGTSMLLFFSVIRNEHQFIISSLFMDTLTFFVHC